MTRVFQCRWLLPIDQRPIEHAWISVTGDRITALGHGHPPAPAIDLGDVAVLPGLVNAHTHLELGHLAGRVPPAASMTQWIQSLIATRAATPASPDAIVHAADEMWATGTAVVGDISNTLSTTGAIVGAGLSAVIFHELIGFRAPDPDAQVRAAWAREKKTPGVFFSVVAHAPYSVSPALFAAIAAARSDTPLSVHLAESIDELEFLETGRGPFRDMLEHMGLWTDSWPIPHCDPAEYMARVGYLQPGCLVVHGVHLSDQALARVRDAGAVLVTCPRSNAWVGSGPPPVSRFYGAGLRVAIGTDSLASAPSLNMFDELAELRRIAPDIAAATLLDSATRVGAEALGWASDYGTLAPGKRAALVAVAVPDGGRDVEEYLVSGVPRDAIRRVDPRL